MSHAIAHVPSHACTCDQPTMRPKLLVVSIRAARSAVRKIQTWKERSLQRQALRTLDEHLLKDIGIERFAALEEAAKPFWR